jgi:hypothetical protein
MELLVSKKFKLPKLLFITDRSEIPEVSKHIGVPFFYGDETSKEHIIRLLEYEILFAKAKTLGLNRYNFRKVLIDEGYALQDFEWCKTTYFDYVTDESLDPNSLAIKSLDDEGNVFIDKDNLLYKKYINDGVAILDIQVLKDLKIFPIWLSNIEEAVRTNIQHFAVFNPNMYNKKLDGIYGGITFSSPKRNLLVFDISDSIPKGIGATCLTIGKNMAESFFCDIIITGRKTKFIPYEHLHTLNIEDAYDLYGGGQECTEFRRLLTSEIKEYETVIITGDNNHIGDAWSIRDKTISDEDGKKLCKWKVNKLISLHTEGVENLAGFARWFSPNTEERIDNWVKYLN